MKRGAEEELLGQNPKKQKTMVTKLHRTDVIAANEVVDLQENIIEDKDAKDPTGQTPVINEEDNAEENKGYLKLTYNTLLSFTSFKEANYLPMAQRELVHYNEFGIQYYDDERVNSFFNLISYLSNVLGRPIIVMDVGCGEGNALKDLLSDNRYDNLIAKAIGISKDYFKPVEEIIKKQSGRFEFYLGLAEEVLKDKQIKADLILDNYGAFFYSENKIQLLESYYEALNEQGRAYIYAPKAINLKIDDRSKNLFDHLRKQFPDIFHEQVYGYSDKLNFTKTLKPLDLSNYQLSKVEHLPSLTIKGASMEELKAGNAIKAVSEYTFRKEKRASFKLV